MSFIFQSQPIRYDLRKVLKPGARVAWVASRYRDFMKPGEIVYLWLAGESKVRGIYGWAEITSKHPQPDANGIFRVEITYRRNFLSHECGNHLTIDEIRSNNVLASMLILRVPVGTNFLLSDEENVEICQLIREKYGEDWLPPTRKS